MWKLKIPLNGKEEKGFENGVQKCTKWEINSSFFINYRLISSGCRLNLIFVCDSE